MNRYIGLGREVNDKWYSITILLFNTMVKFTLYTFTHKRPKYYYYNIQNFDYCMNEQELINFKWFFGIALNYI